MKILIIDDEDNAILLLEHLLIHNCSITDTINKASSLIAGVKLIHTIKPDLVFLDIEMPVHSGLDILEFFNEDKIDFQIVFLTAYSKYAIEAFKIPAIDYLLKPIDIIELQKTIERAQKKIKQQYKQAEKEKITTENLKTKKIVLEIPKGFLILSSDEILYLEADGMYTKIHLKSDEIKLICKPLKYFVHQLKEYPFFFKIHRSFLINLNHTIEITKINGMQIIMSNHKNLPISNTKKEALIKLIT